MSGDQSRAAADETRRILIERRAIVEDDHFVYVSGDHGPGLIVKDLILPYPDVLDRLSMLLAAAVADLDADLVCGPAIAGVLAGSWTARHLGVASVFTEHDPRGSPGRAMRPPFVLHRGFDELVRDRRVLIVDDVMNTGHSVRQTGEVLGAAGAEVAGVAVYITRGNVDAGALGVDDFRYLLEYEIPTWPEDDCELCARGVPVNTQHAHGAEFVARHRR